MQKLQMSLCSAVLVALLFALPSTGRAAAQQPDPEFLPGSEYAAEVRADEDGRGVAFFPARFDGDRPVEILDPAPYRLIATDADDPGEELVYPAGELFDPPSGRYRLWLQGDGKITPFTQLAIFRGTPPPGRKSLTVLPVVPGGRVTVAAEDAGEADRQLRLLYAGGHPQGQGLRQELTRRRTVGELGEGILMPEGDVLAALWDPGEKRYVALSRPFGVVPGETIPAPLGRPAASESHLVAYVDRGQTRASMVEGLALEVVQDGAKIPAERVVTTPWGAYGFWYGLAPGSAVVQGGNDAVVLEPVELQLDGGRITRYQGELSKQLFLDGEGR